MRRLMWPECGFSMFQPYLENLTCYCFRLLWPSNQFFGRFAILMRKQGTSFFTKSGEIYITKISVYSVPAQRSREFLFCQDRDEMMLPVAACCVCSMQGLGSSEVQPSAMSTYFIYIALQSCTRLHKFLLFSLKGC